MPALGYKKSRMGCLRCKQRRVKCDENRPCRACIRHNVECSLVKSSRSQQSLSPSATQSQDEEQSLPNGGAVRLPIANASASPSATNGQGDVPSTSDPYPYFARFTTHPAGKSPDSNFGTCMIDLELMHHWSTHTHQSLPRSSDASDVWQFLVPQMAFRHQYLMNQLLATSAFHLAYTTPERRHVYSLRASQHQDQTISLMRAELDKLSEDNCHALFAVSQLLLFGGFAGVTIQPTEPTIDDILDIFLLTKGISSVLKTSEDIISKGPFKDFFGMLKKPAPALSPKLQVLLDKLDALMPQLKKQHLDDHVQTVLEAEIANLISCIHYAQATAQAPEVRILATWPIFLGNDFIILLRKRDPAAMCLLSYFCIILCITESKFWYMKGWGGGVAKSISQIIDPSWNVLVAWSMGYIEAHQAANP